MDNYFICNCYSFTQVANPEEAASKLTTMAKKLAILGTILIAPEGINAGICGAEDKVQELLAYMRQILDTELTVNGSHWHKAPFSKLKVKVKPEIVSLKAGDMKVREYKAKYVSATDWDEFIANKDVALIDVRNNYEYEMGSFAGAINPNTENFSDFPEWIKTHMEQIKDKKLAIFCTGGIRCEKAASYFEKAGHKEVYQLKGGILHYLDLPKKKSWQGECFVFDDRTKA